MLEPLGLQPVRRRIDQNDGRLQVEFASNVAPSHLVPPKPGLMRVGAGAERSRRIPERQLEKVARLPVVVPVKRKRKPRLPGEPDPRRQPTPSRVTLWKAMQLANFDG